MKEIVYLSIDIYTYRLYYSLWITYRYTEWLLQNISICCGFSPARTGAMLSLWHVSWVLEGGINMRNPNTLWYLLRWTTLSLSKFYVSCWWLCGIPYLAWIRGSCQRIVVRNTLPRWFVWPLEPFCLTRLAFRVASFFRYFWVFLPAVPESIATVRIVLPQWFWQSFLVTCHPRFLP